MKQIKHLCIYIITLVLTFFLVACGGDTSSSTPTTKSTLTLGITDAPIDDAKAVNITVTKIEISTSTEDAGWEVYYEETEAEPAETINLLEFSKGKVFKLASKDFDPGVYGQIRLYLSTIAENNSITLLDDTVHNLGINPGIRNNGVKLVSGFTIKEGVSTELTIDFDVRKSIVVKNPNANPPLYSLKPTIKLITNDVSGSIIFTEPAVGNVGMTAGDVFFLYEAGADISAELTEYAIANPDTESAYENAKSSAIAFIDTNDNNTVKIIFPFMAFSSYDLYKQEFAGAVNEILTPVAGQTGVTLAADDNGELIITE